MSRYVGGDKFNDQQPSSPPTKTHTPPHPTTTTTTAATPKGALIERQGSDGFVIVDQLRQIGYGRQPAEQPQLGSGSFPAVPSATAPPTATGRHIARAASFAQRAVLADQCGDKSQARLLYEQAALLLEEAAGLCESKDTSKAETHLRRAKEYAIRAHELTPPGERSPRTGARQPKLANDPAQLEARGDRLLKQARSEHEEHKFFEAKQLYAHAARCFAAASTGAGDETAKVILSRKAREAQQAATGIAQAMGTAPATATPQQPAGTKIAPSIWDELAARAKRHEDAERFDRAFELYMGAVDRCLAAARALHPAPGTQRSPACANLMRRAQQLTVNAERVHPRRPAAAPPAAASAEAPRPPPTAPSPSAPPALGALTLESGLCVVCYENDATHVIAPCGHQCLCEAHAPALQQCPICRGPVDTVLRVFKP